MLPNTEEEAVSSDGLDWKTSTHDEDLLPNAGEDALSSDGSDGKTSMCILPASRYALSTCVTMFISFSILSPLISDVYTP